MDPELTLHDLQVSDVRIVNRKLITRHSSPKTTQVIKDRQQNNSNDQRQTTKATKNYSKDNNKDK